MINKKEKEINYRIQNFSQLPDNALLSAREINQLTGRSRTSIWRDVMRGLLAEPVKIGPQTVRWHVGDIREFLNGRCPNGSK